MSKLERTAEIAKMARVLGLERHALGYLSSVPAYEIRRLRESAVRRMFDQDSVMFSRLAKASRLLPNTLVAFLGENLFGALLAARISGAMPAERAIDITRHMSIGFLADIAVELDPHAAADIIRGMPAQRVRDIGLELLKRGDFITMGRFTSYLSDATLRCVIEAIEDDAGLLHVGFFMESKERLSDVVRLLPDSRLRHIMEIAQEKPTELWPEALALMAHVDDGLKSRLGDLAAGQDAKVLAGLADITHQQQLWVMFCRWWRACPVMHKPV